MVVQVGVTLFYLLTKSSLFFIITLFKLNRVTSLESGAFLTRCNMTNLSFEDQRGEHHTSGGACVKNNISLN